MEALNGHHRSSRHLFACQVYPDDYRHTGRRTGDKRGSSVCETTKRPALTWDIADGFSWLTLSTATPPTAKDPISALEVIEKSELNSGLFILKDFHELWSNPQVKRKLRSLSQKLKYTKKSILITTTSSTIPPELKDEVVTIDFPLPKQDELTTVLDNLTRTSGVRVNLTDLGKEKIVQAAVGLTSAQAQRVFAKAIVKDGQLDERDIDLITQEKKQIIRENEALEYYAVTENLADVGGLGMLKHGCTCVKKHSLRKRAIMACRPPRASH